MGARMNNKGFTLVETVTVLVIIGIFISFFYTLWFLNWQACEGFLARADFGQEMDHTIDQIADDGRFAKTITVGNTDTTKETTITDPSGNVSKYTMSNNGQLTITRGLNAPETVTEKLDYANSNFAQDTNGAGLIVTIAMTDQIFGHPVALSSEITIYPRN